MKYVKYNSLLDQRTFYHYQKMDERNASKTGGSTDYYANNSLSICLCTIMSERTSDLVNEATAIVLYNDGVNSLKRKIVSIYLAGYNTIYLKSKTGRIVLLNVMQLEKLSAETWWELK